MALMGLGIVLIFSSACTKNVLVGTTPNTTSPLRLKKPVAGSTVGSNVTINGYCVEGVDVKITVPGNELPDAGTVPCFENEFQKAILLEGGDGNKTISFAQSGGANNVDIKADYQLIKDASAPVVTVDSPIDQQSVFAGTLTVTGSCESTLKVKVSYVSTGISGTTLFNCDGGTYSFDITVDAESLSATKTFVVEQTDLAENKTAITREFQYIASNSWLSLSTSNAPSARSGAPNVWTGSKMIVWGSHATDVGAYSIDPTQNEWSRSSTSNAPVARTGHTLVWTGSKMIVWGGYNSSGNTYYNDGGIYDPSTNVWTAFSCSAGCPLTARAYHTAIWTGTEMVVFGGSNSVGALSDGAAYNVSTSTWRSLSSTGIPAARQDQVALWTGTKMIIWGGRPDWCKDSTCFLTSGAEWTPGASSGGGTWTAMSTPASFTARIYSSAVWTGSKMIIFGGTNSVDNRTSVAGGVSWTEGSNTWSTISTASAPNSRFNHVGLWTGSKMMIWGGIRSPGILANGGSLYDPSTNSWSALATASQPSSREKMSAVYTGSMAVIFGGFDTASLDTGARYLP